MKKLLIGLCATTLLAASAVSFAGTLTFVNRYNGPVTFVVQGGTNTNTGLMGAVAFWNWNTGFDHPTSGTVLPGQQVTIPVPGLTAGTLFTAFPTNERPWASNCGELTYPANSATIVAGSGSTAMGSGFGCRGFVNPTMATSAQPIVIYHGHRHHHRLVY